ncbi:MAG: ATP-binding protein, partial [Rudanella sp.]|nr:ATP-binding protein [Rudanella sp.]
MRPGSRNPNEPRDVNDLGRFGLGLKTASFSQCRRLTVVTRRNGNLSAARWDLDRVARTDDWVIEIPDDPREIAWADRIGPKGTLVLWEDLDRLIDVTGSGDRST